MTENYFLGSNLHFSTKKHQIVLEIAKFHQKSPNWCIITEFHWKLHFFAINCQISLEIATLALFGQKYPNLAGNRHIDAFWPKIVTIGAFWPKIAKLPGGRTLPLSFHIAHARGLRPNWFWHFLKMNFHCLPNIK